MNLSSTSSDIHWEDYYKKELRRLTNLVAFDLKVPQQDIDNLRQDASLRYKRHLDTGKYPEYATAKRLDAIFRKILRHLAIDEHRKKSTWSKHMIPWPDDDNHLKSKSKQDFGILSYELNDLEEEFVKHFPDLESKKVYDAIRNYDCDSITKIKEHTKLSRDVSNHRRKGLRNHIGSYFDSQSSILLGSLISPESIDALMMIPL